MVFCVFGNSCFTITIPELQVLQHTCFPDSMPILRTVTGLDAASCCSACVNYSDCVSWTYNTAQNHSCYLRGNFTGHEKTNDKACTSGVVRNNPTAPPTMPAPPGSKNVLMIIIDDLRPQLGCYNITVGGGQKMHTPNIDGLAARGLLFRNAYNQYAVCSPSRNSFMSGRRPDSTLTFNFKDSFRGAPNGTSWIAFPQYFKDHGYNTTGCGKTYHSGHPPNFDEPYSWTQGVDYVG